MEVSAEQRVQALQLVHDIRTEWELDEGTAPLLVRALQDLVAALDADDRAAFGDALVNVAMARPVLADGRLPEDDDDRREDVLVVLTKLETDLRYPPPPPGRAVGTPSTP
ncbi:hypothetical protein [Streptomyces sp. NPDC058872]|uniref:hypothetical protein n=1 Tax=Streptomyces sp. NPDC058872 TaxID=3346661 RepID=UPI003679914A